MAAQVASLKDKLPKGKQLPAQAGKVYSVFLVGVSK